MFSNLTPRPKTENERHKKFQVVDIESMNWTEFIVLGFYDGKNYLEFRTGESFVEYIKSLKYSLNCFAHFGGGFDFMFLLEFLIKQKIEIKKIIPRGSNLLEFSFKIGKFEHTFKDSSALLPYSLKSLTHQFNVETKKGEWDHTKTKGYTPELGEYLKSDCIGLYQVIEAFYESDINKGNKRRSTIASQAQAILRNYLSDPISGVPKSKASEFMRKAAHGGRTEIFKPIGHKIYEYDVNSLYPYVMRENLYPHGKAIGCFSYQENKLGIYEVEVITPENTKIPIIPFKDDKKLIFPVGKFKTFITSVEIEYAKTLGYKFKILDGIYYAESKYYFKEFIDDLYSIRQKFDKNTPMNTNAKLIMNSSYGRFLLRTDRSFITMNPSLGDLKPFNEIKIGNENYELFEKSIEIQTFNNPAIGAFILAYARIHMHKLMNPIADHVYYTDTDSIWTDLKLKSSDKLGDLKLEKASKTKDYYDSVIFLLPKTYIGLSDDIKKIKMKGFDTRKIEKFTLKDFQMALRGELILELKHEGKIAKFKTATRKNTLLLKKDDFNKRIISKYNKRILDINNNTSYPIKI